MAWPSNKKRLLEAHGKTALDVDPHSFQAAIFATTRTPD
jgi:hypothetical protein